MRLIDADALKRLGYKLTRTYPKDSQTMVYETKNIDDIPTIDPVRHGRWVREYDTATAMLMCSVCEGRVIESVFYNATGTKGRSFCPYCGAKMEER